MTTRAVEGLHRHLALVMLAYSFLVHRQMLVWLLQDLVLWFIETEQIKTFRPRRI